jgi:hypothetical protein
MSNINRGMLLNTLIKHETLTIVDLAKNENYGVVANRGYLDFLLGELMESDHIHTLAGVTPSTYTITDKGIKEGARLNAEV